MKQKQFCEQLWQKKQKNMWVTMVKKSSVSNYDETKTILWTTMTKQTKYYVSNSDEKKVLRATMMKQEAHGN